MGGLCNCCCCWWKKKRSETPPADPPVTINPSTPLPQDMETPSINPSANHPQNVISPPPSSSTTVPPPSTFEKLPPTPKEIINNFKDFDITSQADDFIRAIREFLKTVQKPQDAPSTSSPPTYKLSVWNYLINSGGEFLQFVNEHTKEIKIDSKDSFFQSGEAAKMAGSMFKNIGDLHWAVAGLSIVGYLVSKCAKVSDNRTECLELLQDMITLVSHIKDLDTFIKEEKEKFEKAFEVIIEGSMRCAFQLQSGKIFSFLKSTVDSEKLSAIRSKIRGLYEDLNLTATKTILKQKTIRKEILPQAYPSNAVGIEDQLRAVNELLDMGNMEDCSSIAVVIRGLGGIGKTTLAQAVVSKVDRNQYNYASIELDLVSEKNNYKEMQQQILTDAFPSYEGGRKIELRHDKDGRDHLTQAFKSQARKPVFLFIDNALHKKDLEKILPEDLRGLPQRSRILVTTRILKETDMLEEGGLRRKDYPVKTLSDDPALTILCNDPAIRDGIKDDLERMVKLCNGIPLILKIVGAHLRKQKYKADRCSQILGALQTGGEIKEDDLSNCLFNFVYDKLEKSTQEAFLDICCFFYEYLPRRHVEYIVGAEEVASLLDAALITTVMKKRVEEEKWPVQEEEEVLSAHDIIRSIGLRMSESSRIVDENSWIKAEKDEAKLKGIKGVLLENSDCVLEKRRLLSMKDTLRILIWRGRIDVPATDAVTLPELRCIITDCDICGLNVEALHKLAVLQCKKLPTEQRDHLKFPKNLRLIEARRQPNETQFLSKTVPNSSLEELSIIFSEGRDSSEEERIDNSKNAFNRFLEGLNKLKHLKVQCCLSLCELSEQVCGLPQLSTLHMYNCRKLEYLSEFFGQFTNLQELNLGKCQSLKKLPSTFDQLTNLQKLNLNDCQNLEELPSTFEKLTNLQQLYLRKCQSLKELPSNFGQLTNLQKLNLNDCQKLKELPSTFDQLTNLQKLNLSEFRSLKELPFNFGRLINLQQLYLFHYSSLKELPSTFGQFTNLQELNLAECRSLKELPYTFGKLTNLQKLNLYYCRSLEELPSTFDQLTNLQELNFAFCRSLKELPCTFGQLTNLQKLNLHFCHRLKELPSTFGQLTILQKLDLSECKSLKELPSTFGQLTNLQELDLARCKSLKELPSTFDQLTNLQKLALRLCQSFKELPSILNNLKSLEYLNISGCDYLESDICQMKEKIKIVKE